ncbi:MAG TPA: hypothetical protein VF175_00775 [Lacipirellula sp.]
MSLIRMEPSAALSAVMPASPDRLSHSSLAAPGMKKVPHVALLIETSREYARGLLRGVARYHQEQGPRRRE